MTTPACKPAPAPPHCTPHDEGNDKRESSGWISLTIIMVAIRSASSAALRRRTLIGHALGTCKLSRTLSASLSTNAPSAAPIPKRTVSSTEDGGGSAGEDAPAAGDGGSRNRPSFGAGKDPSGAPFPSSSRRRGPSSPTSSSAGVPPPVSTSTTTSSRSDAALPFRHSRHRLPLICTDPVQLAESTQQILEAPPGMFRYVDGKNSRDDAWEAASEWVQRVEFLLRGHAHTLPGTQWNRWLPSSAATKVAPSDDPVGTIAIMESLVDRLWDEGHTYMTVRAARMEEVHGPKTVDEPSSSSSSSPVAAMSSRAKPSAASESSDDEDSSSESSDDDEAPNGEDAIDLDDFFGQAKKDAGGSALSDDDEDEDDDPSYMNDFSLPGPTTHMYDIVLDSVACFPTEPRHGFLLLQNIIGRHGLDGGDERNTNPFTRPTVMSYNAPIRLAANLPYDASKNDPSSSHAEVRDEALHLALGSFDALSHSDIFRNSATYAYLLQAIAKYFPTGTSRGNISLGIFHHARIQGLVDEAVLDAFLSAHKVSNGETFDNWIVKHLGSPIRPVQDLPHRWRRHSRIRRFHPREATY